MGKKEIRKAAFVRLEGVLLPAQPIFPSAYFAANGQGFRERFSRLAQVILTAPFVGTAGLADRSVSNRLSYVPLRGMTEDRIAVLGEELVEDFLKDRLVPAAVALLPDLKNRGFEVVLVSESLAQIAQAVARCLKPVDAVLSNHLAFRGGTATGRLAEPVIGGPGTRKAVLEFAAARGIDLPESAAYGSAFFDQSFLACIGHPCAVSPDPILRWTARRTDWPVLELGR